MMPDAPLNENGGSPSESPQPRLAEAADAVVDRAGSGPAAAAAPSPTLRWRELAWPAALAAIVALAFVTRLALMARGGGLLGVGGYDDGVYYAAADALTHGRLPYRDFLFLQPPGIVVAAAPFAAIGAATSDAVGFGTARVAFMLIGAVNAGLVALILRRFGTRAAVIGGLFYAVFSPAVYAERSVLLEPLGTLGVLLAVCLLRALRRPGWAIAAGVAAGAAADVKIWYLVPALLLAVFAGEHWKRFALAAGAAVSVGYLPFVAAAPVASIQQIVFDQLGRPRAPQSLLVRSEQVLGARAFGAVHPGTVAMMLIAAALAATIVAALTRGARLFAVLLVADSLVLIAAPSWFPHYAALTAPPLALCVGVAIGRLLGVPRSSWARGAVVAVVVLAVAGLNEGQDRRRVGTPVPAAIIAEGAHLTGCVIADDPTVLAAMNVLSRDLADPGCTVWPDVTGYTYARDAIRSGGRLLPRPSNNRWQDDVVRYLTSGSAVILIRPDTGLDGDSLARVERGRVLVRAGAFVLRSTH